MKNRTRWLVVSALVLAYGAAADAQSRRSPRSVTFARRSLASVRVMSTDFPVFVPQSVQACTDTTSAQSCGVGACRVTVPMCRAGQAVTCVADVNQRVPEICDGIDNDCDGVVDNAYGSSVDRSVCPAPRACEPVATVSLGAGMQQWSVLPLTDRGCALPFSVSNASAAQGEMVVNVSTRLAVALTTNEGGLRLFAAGQSEPVLSTVEGLCSPGKRTGAAVLDAGTYVLRAVGDGIVGSRGVSVEAVPVPARTVSTVTPGTSRVPMSTGGGEGGVATCMSGEGVDVRVLVCPQAHTAVLSSSVGFTASLESASSGRVCYAVSQLGEQSVPVPSGSIVVARVWPYGAERGSAFIELR